MAAVYDTINGYGSDNPATKSELTSSAVAYTDPVLGIALNTETDFLWSILIELRKRSVLLQSGLNIQDNIDLYNTDPSIVPQSTGQGPVFS